MQFRDLALFMGLSVVLFACETNDVEPENAGKVSLSAGAITLSEDQDSTTITVSLGSVQDNDVTVGLNFSGTATRGLDFLCSDLIVIPAGSASTSVFLSTVQDTLKEGNETLTVQILTVEGAELNAAMQKVDILIEDDDVPSAFNLILNEILYDPSNNGLDGDANGDGQYAQAEDEFLEFVNISSQPIDLSGYKIFDTENMAINTPNHLIPNGTVIQPGKAFVVFGGGTPTGSFGGATVQTSTFGDLNLNNAGDEMLLVNPDGVVVLRFDIEPLSNNPNESYTRNPDLTGEFEQHAAASTALFSPGTKVDGTPF
ncbi:MAG: lamin tail domain-containing protein [Flavobacteriales bacterium]|nr:lamin tail domain-containing protein [Flavobacteriales bacterium]